MVEKREMLYEESTAISNSDIGTFILGGPKYLKRSRNFKRKREVYFDKGSAFHCYILENLKFNERYYVASNKIGGMFGKFLEDVVKKVVIENKDEIEAVESAYKESEFKLEFKSILTKFYKPEVQEVYRSMLENSSKVSLSLEEFKDIKSMVDAVYQHKASVKLLPAISPTVSTGNVILDFDEVEIYWKFEIPAESTSSFDFPSFEIDCKSKVDRLIIDKINKTVKIVDLKTTGKPARGFVKSYKNYSYYRQLAYYKDAVSYYMKHVLDLDPKDYTFECFIIVAETSAPFCVKVYKPLELDLQLGFEEYTDILKEISWHIKNDVWEDRSEIEDDGIEPITLITFDTIELNDNTSSNEDN